MPRSEFEAELAKRELLSDAELAALKEREHMELVESVPAL